MTLVSSPISLGRPGRELASCIYPTQEIRFVAAALTYPFSGDPQIVVRALAPEIRERPNATVLVPTKRTTPYWVEVAFGCDDHFQAEVFANKCLIVLATAVVESWQITREEFFTKAKELYDKDFQAGVMAAGKRETQSAIHFSELTDRDRVPRKSF